jgi:hypothetical protein
MDMSKNGELRDGLGHGEHDNNGFLGFKDSFGGTSLGKDAIATIDIIQMRVCLKDSAAPCHAPGKITAKTPEDDKVGISSCNLECNSMVRPFPPNITKGENICLGGSESLANIYKKNMSITRLGHRSHHTRKRVSEERPAL